MTRENCSQASYSGVWRKGLPWKQLSLSQKKPSSKATSKLAFSGLERRKCGSFSNQILNFTHFHKIRPENLSCRLNFYLLLRHHLCNFSLSPKNHLCNFFPPQKNHPCNFFVPKKSFLQLNPGRRLNSGEVAKGFKIEMKSKTQQQFQGKPLYSVQGRN